MKRLSFILVDLLIIFGSIHLSFNILWNFLDQFEHNINAFYAIVPVIGVFYLVLMYAFGLYNSTRKSIGDVIYTVFLVSTFLTIGIMAACFLFRDVALAFPRSVIFLSFLFYLILLEIWRLFVWGIEKKGHGIKKVVLIGPESQELQEVIKQKYDNIYDIQAVCGEDDEDLVDKIRQSDVIFLSAGLTNRGREKILLTASQNNTHVFFIPEFRDLFITMASFQKTDDIPTFYIGRMELTYEERVIKRVVDLLLGTIGFLIALPIGFIVAVFVKSDGGPVFYRQERLTRGGKVFNVIKFRTMIPDAEKLSGPVLAGEKDPRITKTGRVIRAVRLDELPQILNILKGEMSIVGPRPERPFFSEQFEKEIPHYKQRLKVKAGLTGLAQVEGKYNTTVNNKLRYDLYYIRNYSLFYDLFIILRTIKILFEKDSTEGV